MEPCRIRNLSQYCSAKGIDAATKEFFYGVTIQFLLPDGGSNLFTAARCTELVPCCADTGQFLPPMGRQRDDTGFHGYLLAHVVLILFSHPSTHIRAPSSYQISQPEVVHLLDLPPFCHYTHRRPRRLSWPTEDRKVFPLPFRRPPSGVITTEVAKGKKHTSIGRPTCRERCRQLW